MLAHNRGSPYRHEDAAIRECAEELVRATPNVSIAGIARRLDAKLGKTLVYSTLRSIRSAVWDDITRRNAWGHYPERLRPAHIAGFSNTPHVRVAPEQAPEPAAPTMLHPKSKAARAGAEERRAWLSEYATANPSARVSEARKALQERFGVGLATAYINDTIGVARQLASLPTEQATPASDPATEAAKQMLALAQAAGIVTFTATERQGAIAVTRSGILITLTP